MAAVTSDTQAPEFLNHTLPDGATLAYEVLGEEHLQHGTPLVVVVGMSSGRRDLQRLTDVLSKSRTILLFDHRGIGDSTYSTPARDDDISLEMMARDLLDLITMLKWSRIAICGYSMGGAVTQQLLFLPFHPERPIPLPFTVTHVLLTATMTSALRDRRYGLHFVPPPEGKVMTDEERKAHAQPVVESLFDPEWNETNPKRLQWWVDINIIKRPMKTILKQKRATGKFDFSGFHEKIPRDVQVLVIHGQRDRVIPFSSAEEILARIPWARIVPIGDRAGSVPSYEFGHAWFEYFDDVSIWVDVVQGFLETPSTPSRKSAL